MNKEKETYQKILSNLKQSKSDDEYRKHLVSLLDFVENKTNEKIIKYLREAKHSTNIKQFANNVTKCKKWETIALKIYDDLIS